MLGKTASGLYWMFRYLERAENTARLIETGFRIALTRGKGADHEWSSVLQTASANDAYERLYGEPEQARIVDFLLRDPANPSSVLSCIMAARQNARMVRTALTKEVWEAVNETYIMLRKRLARPVPDKDIPEVLDLIRNRCALVQGAMHGTMLRNDMFDFARIGTFLERADSTARILDVKYFVLLPSVNFIGSSLDNVQWETVLRSVAGDRAYSWLNEGEPSPMGIASFLIFDRRMPRSLRFSVSKVRTNMGYLMQQYDVRHQSHDLAEGLFAQLDNGSIELVFEYGLHDFLSGLVNDFAALSKQIETDFRFEA
ncbi:alpha-E domain-containing protein [Aliishimia ponticola]|uniref:Alpha-E domain-containing protein n=1 Tax=Aliishimia ponticola TaxID=2499833 RepID=A0A4S4NBA8_9RHOB|nr:alpha-E domain-containing protein [Aliishimia ponticola]THH35308.1 alpha-E domain-containing protein [Aliishimia ponticola]